MAAEPVTENDLPALLCPLTEWLLSSSFEGTMRCEMIVRDIADHYGQDVEVTFLADAAILTIGDRTVSFSREPGVPPLNQMTAFKKLLGEIRDGLPAAGAARRLAEIRAMPGYWSKPWQVLGLVCFTVGFGISVQATWQEVLVCVLTGLLVGLLVIAGAGRRRLVLASPFLASLLVSAVVLVLAEQDLITGGPIQLIVPALFYFIPGDAITAAALELSQNRITAGAARLVYSFVVLLVLAFGALAATVLVGVEQSALFEADVPGNLSRATVWGGWVIFALGVMFTFSMAPRDFPWALGLILLTAGVTELATRAFGDPAGAFAGAMVMTTAALLLARRSTRPPAYVLYLGAFYVLTPGSLGLRGIEAWIGGDKVEGMTEIADMLGLLTAIAVGMLVAAAAVGSIRRGKFLDAV